MAADAGSSEAMRQLQAYVDYLRDLGVHDFYRHGEPVYADAPSPSSIPSDASLSRAPNPLPAPDAGQEEGPVADRPAFLEPPIPNLISFSDLAPLPEVRVAAGGKGDALSAIQHEIGDCTRCPLAYAGRRSIVFGDGDANARLMFVGEGPGADEDVSGVPFVGKAGQLLNNMIQAMGLKRDEVYIANIVKCRPPGNRVPEPAEAQTCDPFLLRQIDVVQPQVVVALGATAAMYLLGLKQSLSSLRGRWHECRGAKLAVTYHPAFLLRDPRQKGEAWKDLQMVMTELGLKSPTRA
ncbi:MAG: uracil-DNA glycosylase [Acidobacteriota bacterium]|nr:uracil-DNA glycosylase [Acidobacteriota bacterium]